MTVSSMVGLLRRRAAEQPGRTAYLFLIDGELEGPSLTYGALDRGARSMAVALRRLGISRGERALLLYPSGLEFIVAFFGCLYAGAVPVPAVLPAERQLPRALPRLRAMAGDAGARLVLTQSRVVDLTLGLRAEVPGLGDLEWIGTDALNATSDGSFDEWQEQDVDPDEIALLQYTSGSTSQPKGVMVSHRNLLYTLADFDQAYRHTPEDVMVTWLPIFHDLGLIYGLFAPLYGGFPCYLMAPEAFLARPMRWLAAISRHRGTHSVAPNFAYDLCVKKSTPAERAALDLRCWELAINAAEPIREETLVRFTAAFQVSGLRPEALSPGYGLAEATLKVTTLDRGEPRKVLRLDAAALEQHRVDEVSADSAGARTLVGSGRPGLATRIFIVDPETLARCAPDAVGEVWIAGPLLAQGYWNNLEATRRIFDARLEDGDGPFLRTGDLGFVADGQLFITGRLKDLVILRGKNHYPQDIEVTVEGCSAALRPGCSAAFAVPLGGQEGGEERLAVVAEVDESRLGAAREEELAALLARVREAIAVEHDVQVAALCLIPARTILKTSSGKIQRRACKQALLTGELAVVAEWRMPEGSASTPVSAPDVQTIGAWLIAELARRFGSSPGTIDVRAPFERFGLDSVAVIETAGELSRWLGRRVLPSMLYDHPSIEALARHLADARGGESSATVAALDGPIAIIGMACRFPGGVCDLDSFWRLLEEGGDAIREVPAERWAIDEWYDADPDAPGKMTTRWGGFVDDVDRFEPEFFGISPREAVSVDPQQRLLLETSWEALERAGQTFESLQGSDTGVYMGICGGDYQDLTMDRAEGIDAYSLLGTMHSTSVGRLSYWLGLTGPNVPVDTACSSSLVAVHLACQALRMGECSMALAGGVNVVLGPKSTVYFSKVRAMSPTGRCHTFSADADGYVRSEGCGVVILKRLADARRDGDAIAAVIRGSAVNQDGRSNGPTAPNGPAQARVIRRALAQAGVRPAEVDYVECHGTGTQLGDPIEVQALASVMREGRAPDRPVVIGSVKTNIGHAEGAAGIAGLIKAVLSLGRERIPGSLHFTTPSPHIAWAELPVRVATEAMAWPGEGAPRFAGVSSFGLGGTNAHVVIADAPADTPMDAAPIRAAELVVLSARSAAGLRAQAVRLAEFLTARPALGLGGRGVQSGDHAQPDGASTRAGGRLARAALRDALAAVVDGRGVDAAVGTAAARGELAFLFTGQGSQVPGMGRGLHAAWPAFREAFDRCAALFDAELGRSLRAVMWAEPGSAEAGLLDRTLYTQPALFTLEVALVTLWRAWGVTPALVAGHSIGEVVAAWVAGVFSLEDAVRLVAARARLMDALPPGGAMVSIGVSEAEAEAATAPHAASVSIAAINGPALVVLAGAEATVQAIAASFAARGVTIIKKLAVSHAFHSPRMDPMLEALRSVAGSIHYHAPSLPLVSNVSGQLCGEEVTTPAYWVRHARAAVRFADGVRALHAAGAGTFIEVGPKPTLVGLVPACLPDAQPVTLASSRAGHDEVAGVLAALGELWATGGAVDWAGVFPAGRRVALPTCAWQRERYWIATRERVSADWFYRLDWPEVARGDAGREGSGDWLVLADRGGVGDEVAALLSRRGRACTVITAADDATDIDGLVRQAVARGEWQGVVYLWGLDAVVSASASGGEVGEATRRATAPVLALVKALGAASRLWVVTRGACAVGEHAVAICQAALWGLGRVVALEHPGVWGGLVDLDPAASVDEARELVAELLAPEADDQLAFRNGRRHTARLAAAEVAELAAPSLSADGSYLVTGGLGALGLQVARRLVDRGARHLVLTSRQGLPDRAGARIAAVEALEAVGARVTVAAVDVAEVDAMTQLLAGMEPPLRGVVHAAGVLEDGLVAHQDADRLARALRPKVEGAWILHTLTRDRSLEFFVLFSSITGVLGAIGQGGYAAGNAVLDALAGLRRAEGLPALSLAWGPWAAGAMGSAAQRREHAAWGLQAMPTAPALTAMERLMTAGATSVVVADMDRARAVAAWRAAGRGRVLDRLAIAEPVQAAEGPRRWRGLSVDEARGSLRALVREVVAAALGFADPGVVASGRGFAELGLDSLMAVRLRNHLQAELGVSLSATVAFDHPTVERLAAHLLAVLGLAEGDDRGARRSMAAGEAIAIVGAACRFPGGVDDLEGYWQLLVDEKVVVGDVPPDRWRAADWYDPDPEAPGRTYVAKGRLPARRGGVRSRGLSRLAAGGREPRPAAAAAARGRRGRRWSTARDPAGAGQGSLTGCSSGVSARVRRAAGPPSTRRPGVRGDGHPRSGSRRGGCRTRWGSRAGDDGRHGVLVVAGGAAPRRQALRAGSASGRWSAG
jgi:acyl transferase domain-containing protein/acyl-CoA synthetase (AMP-forming)/AMP-acid ligase II/acyl carrier protein